MSKTISANRKFLQEQVNSVLNELEGKDPTTIGGKLKKDSAFSQKQRGVMFEKGLKSTLERLKKELIDVPVFLHKKLERQLAFDGSFYRQALLRADLKQRTVRDFFSLFHPINSATTSITKFRYGSSEAFDDRLYKTHDGLIKILNKHKKSNNRDGLLNDLIVYLGTTNSQESILADPGDLTKSLNNKDMDYDQFAISLFRDATGDGLYSVNYKDVFDFLEQLKEEYLDDIKENQSNLNEALVFLVVAEVDPQGSENFAKYKNLVFSELEKNPDLNPINIVRGIGQMSLGAYIEKKISKRPLTFWRSLFIGIAIGMGLDYVDDSLSIPYVTSAAEVEEINKLLALAEQGIKNTGRKGGASAEEEEQIRGLILQAVDIVKTQFKENLESEGLMMSAQDKVGAFAKLSNELEYANTYFDAAKFSITKENYKTQQRNIQYFRNALINMYNQYKVGLSEFSPLQESIIKEDDQVAQKVKIGEMEFFPKELEIAGVDEKSVTSLIKIYDLNQGNIYTKYKVIKNQFGKYIGNSLSAGGRQKGRFRSQFYTWWSRNISRYPGDKTTVNPVNKERYKLEFFTKAFPRRTGLLHSFAGKGGLFRETDLLNLISMSDVRMPERGIGLVRQSGYFMTAFDAIQSDDVKADSILTAQGKSTSIQLPFKGLIATKKVPGLVLSKEDTKKAINELNQYEEYKKGLLLVILAIHDIYVSYLSSVFNGGSQAEDAVVKQMSTGGRGTNTFTKEELILFKFFYLVGDIELFNKKNNISFFRKE